MINEKLVHKELKDVLYVHESFSSMFYGFLNWFQTQFEPRFKYSVISTYDKAVQFFRSKQLAKDGTVQTNILPSITLDPNLDFVNEERSGRFYWMFKNLDSLNGRNMGFTVNLGDQGVKLHVNHTRYSGTCDVTFWLSSIYELMDFRSKLIQFCGGTGRWIRPDYFWTHIIIPPEIINFNKTADNKKLDWSATPLEMIQLNTTNTKEYGIPYPINAIWKLDSLSDGSTKYGADQLTEWRFTATFTWEANIPTFLRLDNFAFNDMRLKPKIHITPTYASQPMIDHINMVDTMRRSDLLRDVLTSNMIYTIDKNPKQCENCTCEYKESDQPAKPFVKLDNTQCNNYPDFYRNWDHISSGKLYDVEYLQKHHEALKEDFILLIDHYNPEMHNDYLRQSNGCLCRYEDENSDFFDFIKSIKLPTICHFNERLFNGLKSLIGECMTMDSISKTIYRGLYPSKMLQYSDTIESDEYDICNNLIDTIIKENGDDINQEAKKLRFGNTTFLYIDKVEKLGRKPINDDTRSIILPNMVTKQVAENIDLYLNDRCVPKEDYEILGKVLTFKDRIELPSDRPEITIKYKDITRILELELTINYIMTKEDELAYIRDNTPITLEIPEEFDPNYVECCSYNGMLQKDRDYTIEDHTITFNMEPMRNKIIQVFANRKF